MSDQTLIQNMKKELAEEIWGKQKKLEERVRELDEHYNAAWDEICRLQKNIDKAKAILESDEYADHAPKGEIQRALNALEGK